MTMQDFCDGARELVWTIFGRPIMALVYLVRFLLQDLGKAALGFAIFGATMWIVYNAPKVFRATLGSIPTGLFMGVILIGGFVGLGIGVSYYFTRPEPPDPTPPWA